ncbi:MAG: hypothetical protein KKB21_02390 [Nanoarchaeota archaeon]|nr:hypothetical protein [Nanoarchaeota archaeon]
MPTKEKSSEGKSVSEIVNEKNIEFQKQEKRITEKFNEAISGLSLLL